MECFWLCHQMGQLSAVHKPDTVYLYPDSQGYGTSWERQYHEVIPSPAQI